MQVFLFHAKIAIFCMISQEMLDVEEKLDKEKHLILITPSVNLKE